MNEPVISREALADLDEAWEYLARRNPNTADRLLDRFFAAARMHAQFPLMGPSRDDISPGLRCFTARPYVAFYRVEGENIVVLRVLHGRRDLKRVMRSQPDPPS
ncbi:type II toxin-antitoxin system RelE/ParE family toxin [Planctomyces sp. SH-PL62]|uniref:type II toxin-antitoxin system RelE/ParE family toxin n=1 Tax=Planctomyces sp. SH-PL62 TaxID=1636152 RepID=UPI00078C4E5E|nr:type II toxin-antitoxin system RelE/ParE family toxin [Planctomyces sp. SH-PL62]AMV37646.1 Toxin ParE3 [Planctomyces sp. SH-PL62]